LFNDVFNSSDSVRSTAKQRSIIMSTTGKNRSTRQKNYLSATLYTTNPIRKRHGLETWLLRPETVWGTVLSGIKRNWSYVGACTFDSRLQHMQLRNQFPLLNMPIWQFCVQLFGHPSFLNPMCTIVPIDPLGTSAL